MTDAVYIDSMLLAQLLEFAITELWYADQDEGCCWRCCSPCSVLKQLYDDKRLDDLVRPRHEGEHLGADATWTLARVDREFLNHAWRLTSCHEPPTARRPMLLK